MQRVAASSLSSTAVQRRLQGGRPVQHLGKRVTCQKQQIARLQARAEVEQAAAAATASTDSEDRVPPGCARYTVNLPKPLGLVLEEGQGGRGVYVAEIQPDGNAARLAPEISVGDELIATSGMVYTTEQEYQGMRVKGGEQYVRLNVRNNGFSTVMAAIGSIKPPRDVTLEFQRCQQ